MSTQSPSVVVLKLLGIVFIAEAAIMVMLPIILPSSISAVIEAIVDSCLLTLICAPLIWWVIIGPVRSMAAAQQMVAVAQLATGVAHELRNPLTSIKMLVQTNREILDAREPLKDDLQIIEDEIRRMERSIQTFLEFARPRTPERAAIDLAALVHRSFTLIEARAEKQNIRLTFREPVPPVIAQADWEQIQQVLLNLMLNALDAMPHGGNLEVELNISAGNLALLTVTDSGLGIAADVLSRLFQPFVTNKETGVGIGLFISKRIATEHGGRLLAENLQRGGARFSLTLPLSANANRERVNASHDLSHDKTDTVQ